jgi:hypothetical protein
MSLRADLLKTNENKMKSVMKEVNSILGHIDESIKNAHDQDKNNAIVSVPITFAIPYMSNKNAQRIVYYKILESLISRNYDVKISLEPDKTCFVIKWISDEEEKDIRIQNLLLAKHTITKKFDA